MEGIAVANWPSPRRQGRRAAIPATWLSSPPSAGPRLRVLAGYLATFQQGLQPGWELPDCRPLLRSFGPQNLSWGTTHGSFTMKGNRDGQKPWSEDELFDLDSALCCGGDIEDIADFLSREVVEVERKASERNLLEPAERRQAAA
jgi:hypothetical protein